MNSMKIALLNHKSALCKKNVYNELSRINILFSHLIIILIIAFFLFPDKHF